MSVLIAFALAVSDPGLAALHAADARVATIGWRLQTANAELCSPTARLPGFAIHALGQYAPALRPALAQDGLTARPAVLAVVPGSAAARAGLRAGDTIAMIGGRAVGGTVGPRASFGAVATTESAIEAALAAGSLTLGLVRDGAPLTLTLTGDTGCASRVQIVPGGDLNARADGQYVQLTTAIVDYAASDDELAVVTAHELAHNILRHRVRLDAARVSRGLFAGFGRSGQAFRQSEYEADRLSIWLLARAGYDLAVALPFWTRFGQRTGSGFFDGGTHPRWRDRLARMAEAIARVRAQRASGAPLVPPPAAGTQQSASQSGNRR